MNRYLRQSFHSRTILAERVLDDTVIKSRDDNIVPMISDAAQCNIEHGDDLISQRLMALEGDRAEEFLALGVAGIVRPRVGLLSGEIDHPAGPPRNLF